MINTREKARGKTDADILIEIYPFSGNVEIKEEIYLYDEDNLLADFGAFLGLFLGASGMTFFDMIWKFIELFFSE